jgi:hypothetical protein
MAELLRKQGAVLYLTPHDIIGLFRGDRVRLQKLVILPVLAAFLSVAALSQTLPQGVRN